MKQLAVVFVTLACAIAVAGQQVNNSNEKRVSLNEPAVALDAEGGPALEATLTTQGIAGAPDAPVTNVHLVIRNASQISFALISGLVTFYDSTGVRCGEGLFKADALAVNESFETDTPGLRVRCTPSTWRIVATSLVPRVVPPTTTTTPVATASRLIISVDGESHPIQLGKPMTISLSDKAHTIVLREGP